MNVHSAALRALWRRGAVGAAVAAAIVTLAAAG